MTTLNSSRIKELAQELGADTAGIARPSVVDSADKYRAWLENGFAGDMSYLERDLEIRFDPEKLLPGARAIIVIGLNYFPSEENRKSDGGRFKVAQYAWGIDYHQTIRKILKNLRRELKMENPELQGRICVDTAPFMDKYWARKAGLGWQGKHTNLVSREFGSWLLLGSLVIDMEVDRYDEPYLDHCGNCRACIEACPTGAIFSEYNLDATRCISYWTIESKQDEIPAEIAPHLEGWVFGCDICISVCPFNKFQKPHANGSFSRLDVVGSVEDGSASKLSEPEFEERFAQSPVSRPGLKGIRRNIWTAGRSQKK